MQLHLGRPLPVWRDRKFALTTCPVLVFTPAMRRLLQTFHRTYELEPGGMGPARWVRREWPGPGRWDEQDNLLVERLEHVKATFEALMRDEQGSATKRRKKRQVDGAQRTRHRTR